MREMPGWRDIKERCHERADEMAGTTDPLGTLLVVAADDNPVTSLKVRPCGLEPGQRPVVEFPWAAHIAKREGKPKHRIRRTASFKRGKESGPVPVILGGPQAFEAGAVFGGPCHHSAASP